MSADETPWLVWHERPQRIPRPSTAELRSDSTRTGGYALVLPPSVCGARELRLGGIGSEGGRVVVGLTEYVEPATSAERAAAWRRYAEETNTRRGSTAKDPDFDRAWPDEDAGRRGRWRPALVPGTAAPQEPERLVFEPAPGSYRLKVAELEDAAAELAPAWILAEVTADDIGRWHYAAADAALQAHGEDIEGRTDDGTRDKLAAAVRRELKAIADASDHGAALLERLKVLLEAPTKARGKRGKEATERLKKATGATPVAGLWLFPSVDGSRWSIVALERLAWPLWARIRDNERELAHRRRTHPVPAAPAEVARYLATSPTRVLVGDDGSIGTPWPEGRWSLSYVPAAPTEALGAMEFNGCYMGKQLTSDLLSQNYARYLSGMTPADAASLEYDNLSNLCERITGSRSGRHTAQLREVLSNGCDHLFRITVDGVTRKEPLWTSTWNGDEGAPLALVLHRILWADSPKYMPADQRLLAPLALVNRMPAPLGRNLKAQQLTADQGLLVVVGQRSREGRLEGGRFIVRFDRDADRRAIAEAADLRGKTGRRWLVRLEEGDPDPRQPGLWDEPRAGEPVISFDGVSGDEIAIVDPGMVALLAAQSKRRKDQTARARKPRRTRRKHGPRT